VARSQDTRGAIVTDNLKHFPEDKIPPGIQIVSPSEFAANTVDVSPGQGSPGGYRHHREVRQTARPGLRFTT
jgi:hypothetical protein